MDNSSLMNRENKKKTIAASDRSSQVSDGRGK